MPAGRPLSEPPPLTRRWAALLAITALTSVLPLWCTELLPFSDLPEQIAVSATLRHWWDPTWHVPETYVFAFGRSQYVLYHLTAAMLGLVLDAETANRLLLSLAGLALPFALLTLLRALGRDPRLALFAPPVFWSRPLLMGFAPYVVAVPFTTWAIGVAALQARQPQRRRALLLGICGLLLFFLHVGPYVLFALAAVGLRVATSPRGALRDLVWLAPSAMFAAGWTLYGALGPSLDDPHGVVWQPLAQVLRELPAWSHDIWRSHVDEACAITTWSAFAFLLVQRGEQRTDRRVLVPLLSAVVAYVALPYSVGVPVMLNVRIAVFVTLFAPLVIETTRGWRSTAPLVATAVASLVLAGDAAFEIRRLAGHEVAGLSRLIDRIPAGARVLSLPFQLTSPRVHWLPWAFVGALHRARRGGVASYSFSELAHWPVQYRPEAHPPGHGLFWTFDACAFRNAVDGAYYDVVLTRGNVDPFRDDPPGPRWRRIAAERDFVLWEKVPGEINPRWTIEDQGPCESRRSLERAAGTEIRE